MDRQTADEVLACLVGERTLYPTIATATVSACYAISAGGRRFASPH